MSTPVIEFDKVYFRYGSAPVIESADFSIHEGAFVSVIGPNGGGKTTIARLMLGLLHPTSGSVRLFGDPPKMKRHEIGYVPQYTSFDPKFPITVMDLVLMGRISKPFGFFSKQDREQAKAALESVGLSGLSGRQFSGLSGGQRQRALIARALAGGPTVLILDEPTSNVDVAIEQRISTILDQLSRSLTIVLITHDLGFVSRSVDTVLCVNKTVRIHPTSEVTEDMIRGLYEDDMRIVDHDTVLGGDH